MFSVHVGDGVGELSLGFGAARRESRIVSLYYIYTRTGVVGLGDGGADEAEVGDDRAAVLVKEEVVGLFYGNMEICGEHWL